MQIRRAGLADAERLGALHSQCWTELYPSLLAPSVLSELSPATMTGLWKRFVTRGAEYVQWVAVIDDTVVGFAGTGPGREAGYEHATELYFIYVTPSARRSGVGQALLKQADADYLWIWDTNRASQKFYRKQKFFPDSVARSGTLFGAVLPEIRMSS